MTFFIGVLGVSGSGKTTIIEKLTRALVARGFKIGAVKHSSHEIFDLKGKDTRRLRDAGADVVVGISDKETMILRGRTTGMLELGDIQVMANNGVDILFIEGYSSMILENEHILKIVVANDEKTLFRFLRGLKGKTIVTTLTTWRPKLSPKIENFVPVGKDGANMLADIIGKELSQTYKT